MSGSDGFNYDLNEARLHGNIFERIFHNRRLNFWLEVVDYSGKRVLDIGCNSGIILIPLKERGVDVVGIDISKTDIDKAKENLRQRKLPQGCVQVGDAKKLPFKSNSFDIVLLSDILEHVSDPEIVAQESIRVAKKRGLVLATVPNELHPVVRFSWVRKLLTGRHNVDEHLDIPFSKQKLTKLFLQTTAVKLQFIGFGSEILGIFKKR
ncbi:MAG: 3-demethylubiquinone-9 3-methyltransferase [Candidatus Daviesbacteria bacterium GW2011_GWA1_41_61]|uniref:3-demethylubiquinone-9 3-methyltransferase n=1 Tax=Candidatus Daviesbacteria bacterium GW2011_GWA2_40_9 TaxID=1618424 RepID=A0A0G0U1R0_9BACT|nr:MAG: 3-demethylubiquinone-9 3-methyltransferase [Candidatus Daviesbacteria bacterium GW2011_GWC1_40_9]KKR83049.1 MAG: 3-demethylubiquinone-9 3-methyltransferase [Candidatus Daviesbacteria bacterium GW2011_GWA2_40_9]KKR92973.1 MAG: 3-demethylubiquinone-9 3-methyltransferase [Candidatus Daviesbacteria bacterium GW2011_GWB1_41_15]KKS15517.1 MAG: 3-demethylubiquinone-9 3-methyltransferase [Candidatus Daviesbacteria bacterium GW2011_GWA1_41_61]